MLAAGDEEGSGIEGIACLSHSASARCLQRSQETRRVKGKMCAVKKRRAECSTLKPTGVDKGLVSIKANTATFVVCPAMQD